MINKKLEKLLEEAIAKRQALKESELGSAAVKPVHGSGEAKEHTPEFENKDVYPADEHEQSEEVEEVIVETYTQEDLQELFEALNLDTDKYTFEYLAEELGFEQLNEGKLAQAAFSVGAGIILGAAIFFNKTGNIKQLMKVIDDNPAIVQSLSDEQLADIQRINPKVADIIKTAQDDLINYDTNVYNPAKQTYDQTLQGLNAILDGLSAKKLNIDNLNKILADNPNLVQSLSDEQLADIEKLDPDVADIIKTAQSDLMDYDTNVYNPAVTNASTAFSNQKKELEDQKKPHDDAFTTNTNSINNLRSSIETGVNSEIDADKIKRLRIIAQWEEDKLQRDINNYHSVWSLDRQGVDPDPDIFTHDAKGTSRIDYGSKFNFTDFDINQFIKDGYKFTGKNRLYISNENPHIDTDKYYDLEKIFGAKIAPGDLFDNKNLSDFRRIISKEPKYDVESILQNNPEYPTLSSNKDKAKEEAEKLQKQIDNLNLDNSHETNRTTKVGELETSVDSNIADNIQKKIDQYDADKNENTGKINNLGQSHETNRTTKVGELETSVDSNIDDIAKRDTNRAKIIATGVGLGTSAGVGGLLYGINKSRKKDEYLSESYTREDLQELFEALNLDTDKYTFGYLAEELGFVPEGELEMEQPEVVEMQPQQDPEYDEEGSMAKSQLITIADAAAELYNMMEDETNLPEWVQSKLTLSKEYIDTARDYLKSEMIKQSQDMPEMQPQPEMIEVPAEAVEQSLQERYVLKRPVGRPSKKSKMLDAKGGTELSEKGEVVYTRNKK
jgi:hypothetical protein